MRPVALFVVSAVLAVGCGGGGCGGGAAGSTGTGGGTGVDQVQKLFGPSRFSRTLKLRSPPQPMTLLVDTAMPAADLAEAAAGLRTFLEARGTQYRFKLVATGATCGPGQVLVPQLPDDRDMDAELGPHTEAVRAALATLQATSVRSTLGAIGALGDSPFNPTTTLLVTMGADACGADLNETLRAASMGGVFVSPVAFKPDPGAHAFFTTLALTTGTARWCPTGTDAECGPDNACADPAAARCERQYEKSGSGAALTDQLLARFPAYGPDLPGPCWVFWEELKGNQRPARAFINGLELKADQWEFDRHILTLKGAACGKVQQSARWRPVKVEIEVPFSVESL